MDGKQIVALATDLAAGSITAGVIKDQYGDGVLTSVLAIAAGFGVGALTHTALNIVDEHTGIVSDLGSLVDDVLSIF